MSSRLPRVIALCMTGLWVAGAAAQSAERPRDGRRGNRTARRERPDGGAGVFRGLIEELELTEKQGAPVQQIIETHQQEMTAWLRQNGPVMRELTGQLRGGRGRRSEQASDVPKKLSDAERKETTDKLRALHEQRAAKVDNVLKQLKDHLTEEQMATARRVLLRDRRGGGMRLSAAMLSQLALTAEQQKKVDVVLAAARKAGKDDGPARRQAYAQAMRKIVQDVLTPEQRQKLEALRQQGPARRGDPLVGLDLTDEQKDKIGKIRASMRERLDAAKTRETRREVLQAMRKEIEAVLTSEQREQMRQRRGGAAGGRRGRRDPNP